MYSILIILTIVIFIVYLVQYEMNRPINKIYPKIDSYGSIQVFDNNENLLVILYKDRTIDYRKQCSLYKQFQIKNISNHFEEFFEKLN